MLEETEIIEIKQGPYAGDRDKCRFDAVEPERVQLRSSAFAVGSSQ